MTVNLSAVLISAGIPGLGGIVGKEDFKKASKIRAEIMSISWLVTTVIGTMILLFNCSFVKLWVGADKFLGFTENLLLVLLMTQLVFIRNDAFIFDVSLKIKYKVLFGAFSACLSLALAFYFCQLLHSKIMGLCLGLMIGRAVLSVSYPLLVKRAFKLTPKQSLVVLIRPLLTMALSYILAFYIGKNVVVDNWFELIIKAVLIFICIAFSTCLVGLSRCQQRQLFNRLRYLPLFGFLRMKRTPNDS